MQEITEADLADNNANVTFLVWPTSEDDLLLFDDPSERCQPAAQLAETPANKKEGVLDQTNAAAETIEPGRPVVQGAELAARDAYAQLATVEMSNDANLQQAADSIKDPGVAGDEDMQVYCMATGRKAVLSALSKRRQEEVVGTPVSLFRCMPPSKASPLPFVGLLTPLTASHCIVDSNKHSASGLVQPLVIFAVYSMIIT